MMIDPQYLTTTIDFKPLFVHISLSIYLLYNFYIQLSEKKQITHHYIWHQSNFFFKSFVFFIVHLSDLGEVLQYHQLSLREPLEPNHSSNAVVNIRHIPTKYLYHTWQGKLPTIQLISSSLTLPPSFLSILSSLAKSYQYSFQIKVCTILLTNLMFLSYQYTNALDISRWPILRFIIFIKFINLPESYPYDHSQLNFFFQC